MKVVILAGGLGSRLAEETDLIPKPMVEIGGKPILWHILKHYAVFGCREFLIALGYKGDVIKRYFLDFPRVDGDLSVDLSKGVVGTVSRSTEDWLVHLLDTGVESKTGGRLKRLEPWLKDAPFMLTYGDGVSSIDLDALAAFHRSHGRIATISAVRPPARFGGLVLDGDFVSDFSEKSQISEGWINGGFMVFNPQIFDYLEGDQSMLETDSLERLVAERQLAAYRHEGFWQCMDTLRDKRQLESLWQAGRAPWQLWQ